MDHQNGCSVDPRSGFCKATSIFHSKRSPVPSPPNPSLDITTFISSQSHHGKIAYIDAITGHQLSFTELWHAVHAVSSCLHNIGIHKGDIVLILSPSSIFFPVVVLSVLSIGAVITTANPLNTAQELAKQIKDSKPALAFTITQQVPKLSGSTFPIVLLDEPTREIHEEARIITTLAEMMKTKTPSGKRVVEQINQDDAATMLYSSGTTGIPKGVVSSHGSLILTIQTRISLSNNNSKDQEDVRFLSTLPMFHVYGMHVFSLMTVASGATAVVLQKFELKEMLSAIEKHKVTHLPLVPPVLVTMVNNAEEIKSKYDLSSLRWVLCSGAPASKELIDGFVDKYPTVEINQGYASTEINGGGTWTDSLEECKRYGTAGKLAPNAEAKIADPMSGRALGVNQKGELWLRGPTIMKGYFNNPDATALAFDSEGWYKTGDLCYIDDDGFLFVVDRLKELIKYKAYQVAPAELEAILHSHPDISDAAVIPFPDNDVGQYPMAYVVRKAGSNLSGKAIMDYVAKQVAPYKKIRRVAFISSIPKNPSGKILRKDLINLATSKL